MTVLMFLMFAGFAEGMMDLSTFRYWDNWFLNILKLFGKERWMYVPDKECCGINKSWENKYKENKDGSTSPKFFLSTTLFVIFTDSFHFFKFIQFLCYFCAVYYAISMQDFDFTIIYAILMYCSSNAGFYLSYKWIDYLIRNI